MSATVDPLRMPMASSAVLGDSSDSRSGRTSQSAPPMPMTGAICRPVTGWVSCPQARNGISKQKAAHARMPSAYPKKPPGTLWYSDRSHEAAEDHGDVLRLDLAGG